MELYVRTVAVFYVLILLLLQGDRMKLDRNAMHFKSLLGKFHNLHKVCEHVCVSMCV